MTSSIDDLDRNPESDGAENRSLKRYRALKSAQIVDASGRYQDCSIIDLHSRGARIRLRTVPQSLGEIEVLLLPEKLKVAARTKWLRGNQCGVEFSRPLRHLERHDVGRDDRLVEAELPNRPLS
jgi:hypothetical protein